MISFLGNLVNKINNLYHLMFNKQKDKVITESIQLEANQELEFSLDSVKEFFDAYIGVCITDFESYLAESDQDINQKITSKMIINSFVQDKDIYLELINLNGTRGGFIRLSPEITGYFIEKSSGEKPSRASRYRVSFYGGDCIEYLDANNQGSISYLDSRSIL